MPAYRRLRGKSVIFDLNIPDDKYIRFGNSDDVIAAWDGDRLIVQPSTDDYEIELGISGSTQKSFDLRIYGNAAGGADRLFWDASNSKLSQAGAAEIELGRHTRTIQWKGSSYTVLAADTGKIFATTSANAEVIFTLPVKASGLYYTFFNNADQALTISLASGSGDEMVSYNDLDLDKISFGSAGRQIGAAATVVCDGRSWFVLPYYANTNTSTAGHVMTVTD